MTEGARKLFGIFDEKQQGIDNIDVAARGREGVWLRLVDQEKFEWMVVLRLSYPGNSVHDFTVESFQ